VLTGPVAAGLTGRADRADPELTENLGIKASIYALFVSST
jgi:hypothetical protein